MKLRIRDVTVIYDQRGMRNVTALDNFSLDLEGGTPIVIWGRNGSGKTTLLRVLSGALVPDNGTIEVSQGENWKVADRNWLARNSEYIHQHPIDGLFPDLTLCENLALRLPNTSRRPLDPYLPSQIFRENETLMQSRCEFYSSRRHQSLLTLSGGEQQLFALTIAEMSGRTILLCDEPSSSLDTRNKDAALAAIGILGRRKDTFCLVVTHDQAFANRLGFPVVEMPNVVDD